MKIRIVIAAVLLFAGALYFGIAGTLTGMIWWACVIVAFYLGEQWERLARTASDRECECPAHRAMRAAAKAHHR